MEKDNLRQQRKNRMLHLLNQPPKDHKGTDTKDTEQERKVLTCTYTFTKSYYLDTCIQHLENCLNTKNYTKWYNDMERVPAGYKPTRLF
jgi:hypothetical protein